MTSPTNINPKKHTKIYKTITKSYFKKLEEDIILLETSFMARLQKGEFQEMKDFLLNRLLEIDVIFKKKSSSLKKIVLLESIFREENKILEDEKESLVKEGYEKAVQMLVNMNIQCFESCEKIKERLIKMIIEKYNSTREEVISLLEDQDVIIKEGELLLKRKEKQNLLLKSYVNSNILKVDKTREAQILFDFSENLRKYEKQIDLKMSIVNKEMVEKNEKHLMERKIMKDRVFGYNHEYNIDGIDRISRSNRKNQINEEDDCVEIYENEENDDENREKEGNSHEDDKENEEISEDNENNCISIYDLYTLESIEEFTKQRLDLLQKEMFEKSQNSQLEEERSEYNSEIISNLSDNLKKNGSLDMNELHILSYLLGINNSIELLSKVGNSGNEKDGNKLQGEENINEEVTLLISQNKNEIRRFLHEVVSRSSPSLSSISNPIPKSNDDTEFVNKLTS